MQTSDVVLYLEDDGNDAVLFQHAFENAVTNHRLIVVSNGTAAVEYLTGHGKHADRAQYPLPRLVLLDMMMPGVSGIDVLKWIRGIPRFSTLVVLMLTSSNRDSDIQRAYELGANGYLVKPTRAEELTAMAKSIGDFWLTRNRVAVDGGDAPPDGCESTVRSDQEPARKQPQTS
jgi:CheY-like chemotaxis protein